MLFVTPGVGIAPPYGVRYEAVLQKWVIYTEGVSLEGITTSKLKDCSDACVNVYIADSKVNIFVLGQKFNVLVIN